MEEIKPCLTNFIDGGDFFNRILIVESAAYISDLLRIFPASEIFFVTADEDFDDSRVEVELMDYRQTRLPFEREFFDLIIGDLTLETVTNPQDIAAGFSQYIKPTGAFITSFRNIRHWKVLEKLMRGKLGSVVARFYTRAEFEILLYASFYKNVRFAPLRKPAPPDLLKKFTDCGFENFGGDLEAEFWLVRADRSMPELSLLKSMFTPEIRAFLARLLHRIEYDVATAQSAENFWRLYDSAGLFEDYVAEFIGEIVIHREQFFENLRAHSPRGKETFIEKFLPNDDN